VSGAALGRRARLVRAFSLADLEVYACLTGAAPRPAALPPALVGGLFSRLLGTELPGRGTNWLKQRLRFAACARAGEWLTAEVEVTRVRREKDLVSLRTTCLGEDGRLICDGEALVLMREMWQEPGRGG
jgi:acyl dehydratase